MSAKSADSTSSSSGSLNVIETVSSAMSIDVNVKSGVNLMKEVEEKVESESQIVSGLGKGGNTAQNDSFHSALDHVESIENKPTSSMSSTSFERESSETFADLPEKEQENPLCDRYGFFLEASKKLGELRKHQNLAVSLPGARKSFVDLTETEEERSMKLLLENSKMESWLNMLPTIESKLRNRRKMIRKKVRKGIPNSLRAKIWPLLVSDLDSRKNKPKVSFKRAHPDSIDSEAYSNILEKVDDFKRDHLQPVTDICSPSDDQESGSPTSEGNRVSLIRNSINCIKRDLNRTFPNHGLFSKPYEEGGFGQSALLNILSSYAYVDPSVGYCQGMGFVVGVFLNYLPEEKVFGMLKKLLNNPPYNMRTLYQDQMPGIQLLLFQLEHLMPKYCKKLDHIFKHENIVVNMFATHWFVTVFSYNFPWDLVLRIYDVFLFEGWKIVMKIALVLLRIVERIVLQRMKFNPVDFEVILEIIKQLPVGLNTEQVMTEAYQIKLTRKQMLALENRFNASQKASESQN